jgi:hypothetical protein
MVIQLLARRNHRATLTASRTAPRSTFGTCAAGTHPISLVSLHRLRSGVYVAVPAWRCCGSSSRLLILCPGPAPGDSLTDAARSRSQGWSHCHPQGSALTLSRTTPQSSKLGAGHGLWNSGGSGRKFSGN